eukprot:m.102056 g.102056  ORF g.102056 m.102056 type:complete len:354 (+) comp51527_c0_seq1:109-1170(+)
MAQKPAGLSVQIPSQSGRAASQSNTLSTADLVPGIPGQLSTADLANVLLPNIPATLSTAQLQNELFGEPLSTPQMHQMLAPDAINSFVQGIPTPGASAAFPNFLFGAGVFSPLAQESASKSHFERELAKRAPTDPTLSAITNPSMASFLPQLAPSSQLVALSAPGPLHPVAAPPATDRASKSRSVTPPASRTTLDRGSSSGMFVQAPGELDPSAAGKVVNVSERWSDEILTMDAKQLNDFINTHNLTPHEIEELKAERRRGQNRLYAKEARARKKQREQRAHGDAEAMLEQLKAQFAAVQSTIKRYRRERAHFIQQGGDPERLPDQAAPWLEGDQDFDDLSDTLSVSSAASHD